jgi:hypothetical protein
MEGSDSGRLDLACILSGATVSQSVVDAWRNLDIFKCKVFLD